MVDLRESFMYKSLKKFCQTGEPPNGMTAVDFLDYANFEICLDAPYSDDWISHGYSSWEEWHDRNKESLEFLDELLGMIKEAERHVPGYAENDPKIVHRNPFDIMDEFEKLEREYRQNDIHKEKL